MDGTGSGIADGGGDVGSGDLGGGTVQRQRSNAGGDAVPEHTKPSTKLEHWSEDGGDAWGAADVKAEEAAVVDASDVPAVVHPEFLFHDPPTVHGQPKLLFRVQCKPLFCFYFLIFCLQDLTSLLKKPKGGARKN